MLSLISMAVARGNLTNLSTEMENHFWSTQGISKEAHSQISNKILFAKIIVCCVYLDTIASGTMFAANLLFPNWPIIHNCSVEQCIVFMGLAVLAFTGICCTINAHVFSTYYWTLHVNLQLRILSVYFDTIEDDIIEVMDGSEKWYSVSYQAEIRKRLVIGIKHHAELVRWVCIFLARGWELWQQKCYHVSNFRQSPLSMLSPTTIHGDGDRTQWVYWRIVL